MLTTSTESLSNPSKDPINNIGETYFKQRDKAQLEQKSLETAVKFSLSVAVLGGPGAGKKSLISTECKVANDYMNKSSIKDIGIHIYTVADTKIRVTFYVAPGSEAHLKQSAKLLTGLSATIFVFDVNDENGLDYLDDWLDYSCPKKLYNLVPKKFIIGNKTDTPGQRVILSEMGSEFAELNNLQYYETCTYDPVKVHGVFEEIVKSLVEMSYASGIQLPQFELKTIAKGIRSSFLSRIEGSFNRRRSDNDEAVSSQAQICRTVASMEIGASIDLLKPINEISSTGRKNSYQDQYKSHTSCNDDETLELFYSYSCQKGVSVSRKVRVFQRQQQLKESAAVNEGTLVMDWM